MTERWEKELHKLREVGPSNDTWDRAQQPPRGHGMPPGHERARAFAVVAVIVFAVAAFGWTSLRGGGTQTVTGGTETPAPSATSEPSPVATDEPTPSTEPSPTVAQWGDPVDIADGRYFVHITAMAGGDQPTVTFDLEYFYKGAEARQQAAADGSTVSTDRWGNDIYIVNDNPKLRTYAVSPDATVTFYKEAQGDPTTTLTPIGGTLQNLIAGFNCDASTPVGLNPMNVDYWITLDQGQITSFEEAMDVVGDPAPDGPCWMPG
jgi:hypothetical protein